MNVLGVVMNVGDLDRSVAFYQEVLGFTLVSREDELAAMSASEDDPHQVVVLRAIGSSPISGARHVGLRAFMVEAGSSDQLERIASELDARRLLNSRRDRDGWSAVVGRDPDGVGVVVVWHPSGREGAGEAWTTLDDFLYGIGE